MNKPSLFSNAVRSIQIGIEVSSKNDPRRALSAVRNSYAGILLLAKEVLVRAVPNANSDDILSNRYKPVPEEAAAGFEPTTFRL